MGPSRRRGCGERTRVRRGLRWVGADGSEAEDRVFQAGGIFGAYQHNPLAGLGSGSSHPRQTATSWSAWRGSPLIPGFHRGRSKTRDRAGMPASGTLGFGRPRDRAPVASVWVRHRRRTTWAGGAYEGQPFWPALPSATRRRIVRGTPSRSHLRAEVITRVWREARRPRRFRRRMNATSSIKGMPG